MTKRREWPNTAVEARDRAAEEAAAAGRDMRGLMDVETDARKQFILARVLIRLQNILRWLESVGAPTKPE